MKALRPPAKPDSAWQKTPYANLIRYNPSGIYFARFRVKGKLIRHSYRVVFKAGILGAVKVGMEQKLNHGGGRWVWSWDLGRDRGNGCRQRGGGTNAVAYSQISVGVATNILITNAGFGFAPRAERDLWLSAPMSRTCLRNEFGFKRPGIILY